MRLSAELLGQERIFLPRKEDKGGTVVFECSRETENRRGFVL